MGGFIHISKEIGKSIFIITYRISFKYDKEGQP